MQIRAVNLLKRFRPATSRAAHVRPAVSLPSLALPPIHEPVQSLEIFTDPSRELDPIPLGVDDEGTAFWRSDHGGAGLLLLGGTGAGATVLAKAVTEQCRTRGWQVIIADGRGTDFVGYRDCANVSYLGLPRVGIGAPEEHRRLEALVIAHRILTTRMDQRATGTSGHHVGFTPMLLVLNEFAGLMTQWASQLSPKQLRQVLRMVEDLLHAGAFVRCHVLIVPASGWHWQVPSAWNTLCTAVFLGPPNTRDAARFANTDAILRVGDQMSREHKGLGMLVALGAPNVGIKLFQTFWTYSPGEEIGRPRLPDGVKDHWQQFKDQVCDRIPALYPKLCLDRRKMTQSGTAELDIAELLSLPLVVEDQPG